MLYGDSVDRSIEHRRVIPTSLIRVFLVFHICIFSIELPDTEQQFAIHVCLDLEAFDFLSCFGIGVCIPWLLYKVDILNAGLMLIHWLWLKVRGVRWVVCHECSCVLVFEQVELLFAEERSE